MGMSQVFHDACVNIAVSTWHKTGGQQTEGQFWAMIMFACLAAATNERPRLTYQPR